MAFPLVGDGRVAQWSQIARGEIVARGPKPRPGFAFSELITSP
jgi:hypothetical protein